MKKLLFLLLFIGLGLVVQAAHLKGGWIKYEYLGDGSNPNTSKYRVTIRQYLDSMSNAGQIDAFVALSVFDGLSNQIVQTFNINSTSFSLPSKKYYDPCITPNPPNPRVNYRIDEYVGTIDLPNNINGYTLSVQRCCRVDNIANVVSAGNNTGITYVARIPGVMNGIDYSKNSNPDFIMRDTVLLCYNAPFTFSFSATDADGDSLSYMFCEGVNTPTADPKPAQSSNPPFPSVTYNPGYTGSTPLGNKVSIDPVTGIISGIAPGTVGTYVVSVCVNEYRNGVLFNTNRKEIHVNVANCSLAGASLKPSYITCDGFTLNFENESASSSIASYLWTFGETGVAPSSNPTPTHTYKDTGTYTLKLKVTSTGGCQDSTTALVRVYPGFTPDFTVQGTCYINSYRFLDATTTRYGVVDSWRWDLGDLSTNADTARSKDTAWKYSTPQSVQVRLIATNSKGCIDTVVKTVSILDKPIVNLAFKDTLICSIDTLALRATINNGTILWEPQLGRNSSRIINPNSTNPLVYPLDTTRYIVTVNDNGCQNKDTVTVNVLNFIKVELGPDTAICLSDQFRLRPISDALSYQWTASTGVPIASNSKYPLVQPLVNTKYYVIANLGKCQDRDSVAVRVVPYPYAVVMPDTA
ncbi:MAG: PKD domain-containing protein, partial [Chitinophagaceae bacterium]|nr:PKD domain-containing protein [Chitinophagaceae bacterium]